MTRDQGDDFVAATCDASGLDDPNESTRPTSTVSIEKQDSTQLHKKLCNFANESL